MQEKAHPLYERMLAKEYARPLADDTAEEAAFERVLAQLSRRGGDPPPINPTIPPIENPTIPPIDNLRERSFVDGPGRLSDKSRRSGAGTATGPKWG